MQKRKIQMIFSLTLAIMFLAACSPAVTQSPPPTATPITEEPQAAATEPPDATDGGGMPVTGAGLCANAYLPVRQGATWSFRGTGSPAGDYTYTDTITSVRDDGFTLTSQFEGNLTRTQEWACEPGGLVALQLGGAAAASLNMGDMQLHLTANDVTGVTFPSEIQAGDEWQHALEFTGELSLAGTTADANGRAQSNFSALGEESVTVPAGTFEAMKVQADTTVEISATFQGMEVPVTFSGTYTYWFVQGVGLVRASGTGEFSGTSFTETIELQSYTIP